MPTELEISRTFSLQSSTPSYGCTKSLYMPSTSHFGNWSIFSRQPHRQYYYNDSRSLHNQDQGILATTKWWRSVFGEDVFSAGRCNRIHSTSDREKAEVSMSKTLKLELTICTDLQDHPIWLLRTLIFEVGIGGLNGEDRVRGGPKRSWNSYEKHSDWTNMIFSTKWMKLNNLDIKKQNHFPLKRTGLLS